MAQFFIVIIAKIRMKEWAKLNHLKLVKCHISFVEMGPFSYFGSSAGQYIFKIEVINDAGETRTGFARVSGFFMGLLRDRVEVSWK